MPCTGEMLGHWSLARAVTANQLILRQLIAYSLLSACKLACKCQQLVLDHSTESLQRTKVLDRSMANLHPLL